MLMFLGHTAGQQMFVGENSGSFYYHHKVIVYLIGTIYSWYFLFVHFILLLGKNEFGTIS